MVTFASYLINIQKLNLHSYSNKYHDYANKWAKNRAFIVNKKEIYWINYKLWTPKIFNLNKDKIIW